MGNLSLTGTATDWLKFIARGNLSYEQNADDRRQLGWGPNYTRQPRPLRAFRPEQNAIHLYRYGGDHS